MKNKMVRVKKKNKICDRGSQEDWISKLPDPLICEILFHLPTKDAVRTSVFSTRWRNLWQWVPGLDLDYRAFSGRSGFESFVERFIDSHNDSCLRKLRVCICYFDAKPSLTSLIDAVTKRKIQHIDVGMYCPEIPPSIYTCETLVHLRLFEALLPNAEFVSLPCLKIIHLQGIDYPNVSTLEKLISGSPLLEDITIDIRYDNEKRVIQVCSPTVKRIHIEPFTLVIDAPLLQFLRTKFFETKSFKIIHSGFPAKLDIDGLSSYTYSESFICDVLTDISRVRELVVRSALWKHIFLYSKSGPVLQFRDLSCLNAEFCKSNLEMLPTILESCPKLESLTLELVKDPYFSRWMMIEPNPKVMFTTAPQCLVSSLKFVRYKRSFSRYEGEMELVRYFLKNSTILKKFRLDIYDTERTKCAVLQQLVAMPRCSSSCEVNVFFVKCNS